MKRNFDSSSLFCCRIHIKTGTIVLGIIHVFLNTFFLSVMVMMCFKPSDIGNNTLISNETETKFYYFNRDSWLSLASRKTWNREDKFVGIMAAFLSLVASLFLILGVVKGRATFMVPFFSMQLLDFCLTSFATLSYFAYMRDVKKWIISQNIPFRQEFAIMKNDWLLLILVFVAIMILVIKAYLLQLVWKCMKYISISFTQSSESHGLSSERRTEDSSERGAEEQQCPLVQVPTVVLIHQPPKYEDAVHMPLPSYYAEPPPQYRDAV